MCIRDRVREKHGDPRRTAIDRAGPVEITEVQNIIEAKSLQLLLSPDGYLRLLGEGRRKARKDYPLLSAFEASTMDYVLFVSNLGKVYSVRANNLPETGGRGETVRRLLNLGPQEQVVGAFATDASVSYTHLTLPT